MLENISGLQISWIVEKDQKTDNISLFAIYMKLCIFGGMNNLFIFFQP